MMYELGISLGFLVVISQKIVVESPTLYSA